MRPSGWCRLGLQPGQHAQGLGVALEAPDGLRDLVQRRLAVVTEGRVPEVVGEARGVDDVGVAAESLAEFAAHLRHLERVGQPVTHEVVGARCDHLSLGRQPAQRRGVQDAGAVSLEGRPARPLGWLGRPPFAGRRPRIRSSTPRLDDRARPGSEGVEGSLTRLPGQPPAVVRQRLSDDVPQLRLAGLDRGPERAGAATASMPAASASALDRNVCHGSVTSTASPSPCRRRPHPRPPGCSGCCCPRRPRRRPQPASRWQSASPGRPRPRSCRLPAHHRRR